MNLSKNKKDRIAEQILLFLFHSFPKQLFTAEIAREVVRDEEFIKKLLFELKEKGFVTPIRKNTKGISFRRRIKWGLTSRLYNIYSEKVKQ